MNRFRSALVFAACAAMLAFSSPAFAGNDKDGDTHVQGGTGGTATASPTVNNTPTFTNSPKVEATGGNSTLGSLNKFGGDGGNSTVLNTNGQQQGQDQGQLQGQGQQQGQVASSNQGQQQAQSTQVGQANQQSATSAANVGSIAPVQAVSFSSPKQFRDAPDIGAPITVNVSSCAMADGAYASFPGGGGGFSKSKVDPDCTRRADAAMWLTLGEKTTAVNRMYGMTNTDALNAARKPIH